MTATVRAMLMDTVITRRSIAAVLIAVSVLAGGVTLAAPARAAFTKPVLTGKSWENFVLDCNRRGGTPIHYEDNSAECMMPIK